MAAVEPAIDAKLDFFAGTVAGVASLLCGHPFDTIKVRLQCQPRDGHGYRNSVHAFSSILRHEQFRGLYKGVTSPMLGVAAVNASVFGFYGMVMRLQLTNPADSPTLTQITLAGTGSGLATSFLTCPIERLKILQQAHPPHLPVPSTWTLLVSLLRTSGLRSLYRGITATLIRDTAYGPYFLTYEAICRGWPGEMKRGLFRADLVEEVETESREVGWGRLLVAGGAAGIVGWGSTFAVDVIKTRIQATEPYLATEGGRTPHPFRTTWSTALNSYRNEGPKVFTAGLGPTLLRAVPVNMVCFFVFEAVVSALR